MQWYRFGKYIENINSTILFFRVILFVLQLLALIIYDLFVANMCTPINRCIIYTERQYNAVSYLLPTSEWSCCMLHDALSSTVLNSLYSPSNGTMAGFDLRYRAARSMAGHLNFT